MGPVEDLPTPDSEEIARLFPRPSVRVVYAILFEHRDEGISMLDLRRAAIPRLAEIGAADEQEHLDRRKRDIHPYFIVNVIGEGTAPRHQLIGRKTSPRAGRASISRRMRAEVLRHGRCAMCGRTPAEDGVKLVVDHKIPLEWGGSNDIENLQALCEDDNAGKKDHFATYDQHAEKIRRAIGEDEPHRRIGELLKAFEGEPVRSDLLELVASAKQYQEDWQKRLRELRPLGWIIKHKRRREGGRDRVYYRLEHYEPWPIGSVRAEISRREQLTRKRRAGGG